MEQEKKELENYVDLIPADAEKEMKQLAADARKNMQAYVRDGLITEEGLDTLVKLFVYGKTRHLSKGQIGDLIGYEESTMSRVFNGVYKGKIDAIVKYAEGFFDLEAERKKLTGDVFIETTTWRKVQSTCNLAIRRNAIARITGLSQIGKTCALKEYIRQSKLNVIYVRIPAAPTFKLVVEEVCFAVGQGRPGHIETARSNVVNALSKNTLIIIDELHELIMSAGKSTAMKSLEWFREIFDNSGCGMVLCGTSAMEDDLINDPRMKGWLGQLDQRCIRITKLPNRIPDEDIDLAAKTYGISGDKSCVENILKDIRMNRLMTCLKMTVSWCNGENQTRERHPKNWQSFKAVYKAVFEGEE